MPRLSKRSRLALTHVVHLAAVLVLVSISTFLMVDLIPGDPAAHIIGVNGTPEQYAAIHDKLNLDQPLPERYFDWIGNALHGDLGSSLLPPSRDVSDLIRQRLPVTLEITVLSMVMAIGVVIPLGMLAAYRPMGAVDRFSTASALAALSTPNFLAGLLLIYALVFHVWIAKAAVLAIAGIAAIGLLRSIGQSGRREVTVRVVAAAAVAAAAVAVTLAFPDFPRQGFSRLTASAGLGENLRHAFLPSLTVALAQAAVFLRVFRGDLLATLDENYILAARARGIPTWRIFVFEALRPSSFSLITVFGIAAGASIGGTVIVEVIFNLPGMGTLLVDSIGSKDFAIVQGCVLIIAVVYVLSSMLVNLAYVLLDPRLRRASV